MASMKLGPSGSETTLPTYVTISLPTTYSKQLEGQEMSDGSIRWNIKSKRRRWNLAFTKLTATEKDTLVTLFEYDQTLRWQNNDESATWYTVVITYFEYDAVDPINTTKYYKAWMTLEESI